MVKVYVCPRCGGRVAGQMGAVPPCGRCGIPPRTVEVDLGGRESVPRYLNWAGAALLILSVFIFFLSALSVIVLPLWAMLAPVVLSILLLIASLVMQRMVVSEAIRRSRSGGLSPNQRRVKSPPGRERGGAVVRGGALNAPSKGRAVKIPVDR